MVPHGDLPVGCALVQPAALGDAIEVAVVALHEPAAWEVVAAEGVDRGDRTRRIESKDRAAPRLRFPAFPLGTSGSGDPVHPAIGGDEQRHTFQRPRAIGTRKFMKLGLFAVGRDDEDGAKPLLTSEVGGPEERAVGTARQCVGQPLERPGGQHLQHGGLGAGG